MTTLTLSHSRGRSLSIKLFHKYKFKLERKYKLKLLAQIRIHAIMSSYPPPFRLPLLSMFLPGPDEKNGTLRDVLWSVRVGIFCALCFMSHSLIFGSFVFQEWCFHLVSCHEKLGLPINLEPPTGTLAGILSYCLPPSLWLPLPVAYFWDYLIQPKCLFVFYLFVHIGKIWLLPPDTVFFLLIKLTCALPICIWPFSLILGFRYHGQY